MQFDSVEAALRDAVDTMQGHGFSPDRLDAYRAWLLVLLPDVTDGLRCPDCLRWEPDAQSNCSVGESAVCPNCDEAYRYDDPDDTLECPQCSETLHKCPQCSEWGRPQGPEKSLMCCGCYAYNVTDRWQEQEAWWCEEHEQAFADQADAEEHWRSHVPVAATSSYQGG
jgi:hypothetical protein